MNDEREKAPEAEAAAEAEDTPAKEETKLREIGDVELQEILAEHRKWSKSKGKEGEKADLSNTNLRGKKPQGKKSKPPVDDRTVAAQVADFTAKAVFGGGG